MKHLCPALLMLPFFVFIACQKSKLATSVDKRSPTEAATEEGPLVATPHVSTSLDYEGLEIELPISHNVAVNTFSLDSETSLRKGNIENREVLVHEGQNDRIVGVTFYEKCDSYETLKDIHKIKYSKLETKYGKKFRAVKFGFFTSLDGNYYLMQLKSGATIVLGDVMYSRAGNNYVTVSFFQDLSEKEILLSLDSIYSSPSR